MRFVLLADLFVKASLPAVADFVPIPPILMPEPAAIALLAAGIAALLGLTGWLLGLYDAVALAWELAQHVELP